MLRVKTCGISNRICHCNGEIILDIRHFYSYILSQFSLTKGRLRRGDLSEAERVRCPRMGLSTLFPGGLGIMSPGIMTGAGGASLDWDRRWRITPAQTASQEAWPEAEP
jgi:hypothetical protein